MVSFCQFSVKWSRLRVLKYRPNDADGDDDTTTTTTTTTTTNNNNNNNLILYFILVCYNQQPND
jgi:hypothetical protein